MPLLGLNTYFILARKCDEEMTTELHSMWIGDSEVSNVSQSIGTPLTKASSINSKKANSLPSILDEMANSGSDSNSNLQEAPLRTTRSVSQDRKKKLYHQQRSQQDELSPLSPGNFSHLSSMTYKFNSYSLVQRIFPMLISFPLLKLRWSTFLWRVSPFIH